MSSSTSPVTAATFSARPTMSAPYAPTTGSATHHSGPVQPRPWGRRPARVPRPPLHARGALTAIVAVKAPRAARAEAPAPPRHSTLACGLGGVHALEDLARG